jgi:hypothetical protein
MDIGNLDLSCQLKEAPWSARTIGCAATATPKTSAMGCTGTPPGTKYALRSEILIDHSSE